MAMAMILLGVLSACSWVKLTPQGEKVRVLTVEEVAKCQHMGQTTVSLMAKVAGLDRYPEQVQDELNVLARNSAVDLKGDTVAPISPVTGGKQVFGVYRCMP
jgi:hypothetical protein